MDTNKTAWLKRTEQEIEHAIKRLAENKENCNRYNFFGEDNHKKLDVIMHVLSKRMHQNQVYDLYPSTTDEEHSLWQAANTAWEFMYGDIELNDMLYPEK